MDVINIIIPIMMNPKFNINLPLLNTSFKHFNTFIFIIFFISINLFINLSLFITNSVNEAIFIFVKHSHNTFLLL